MLFGLLIVLPATIIVWLLLRLFRVRSRISFGRLHEAIGPIILGGWIGTLFVIGPIVGMIFWGGVPSGLLAFPKLGRRLRRALRPVGDFCRTGPPPARDHGIHFA